MLAVDESNLGAIAGIAALTAVVGFAAVHFTRTIGRWFRRAIVASVGDGIRDITAPDLKSLADSVTAAIEELSASIAKAIEELSLINSAQHELVDGRLTSVEGRLTDVEHRLMALEKRIGIRSSESRTRVTDAEGGGT